MRFFDVRQVGDRELEDLGLDAVRLDPIFRVFLNVENEELELVVVFGRLHHLADPLSVARAGLAGEDRRLFGAEVEQLGENLLVGAFRDARRAGFDFELQALDAATLLWGVMICAMPIVISFGPNISAAMNNARLAAAAPPNCQKRLRGTTSSTLTSIARRSASSTRRSNYHGREGRAHLLA